MQVKKSAIAGEYIITVNKDNRVSVCRVFDNVLGSLRECAEAVGFEYDPKWNTRHFGKKLVQQYGDGGNEVCIGNYTIAIRPSGTVESYRSYDNTLGALREIAAKEGFEYDPKWNTQHFGSKLVDFINGNK